MQHILLVLGGMAVVILVLALLWGATALVGRLFAAPRAPAAPTPAPAPANPAIPHHHRAAIAAAVAVMTGGRGRVVRVSALPHRAEGWVQHARAGHAAGHRVRWDWAVPGPPHIDHAPTAREGQP